MVFVASIGTIYIILCRNFIYAKYVVFFLKKIGSWECLAFKSSIVADQAQGNSDHPLVVPVCRFNYFNSRHAFHLFSTKLFISWFAVRSHICIERETTNSLREKMGSRGRPASLYIYKPQMLASYKMIDNFRERK